jgi:RNA-directed DNA polymerase
MSSISAKQPQAPLGSRIGHSTPRTGKPSTWGRSRRKPVAHKGNMCRIGQAGKSMQTSLWGIANKARNDPHHRFTDLFGLLNEEGLTWCWRDLNKKAASGVDGVTAQEYAMDLHHNIAQLAVRVLEDRYKARLVRRKHIPKDGGKRPLGIPVLEDRLLQLTGSRVLEAIYEPLFLPCSWAYRKKRGAHQAVRTLTRKLQFGCYGYVVDVDIKGFFDNIDHDLLLKILKERIADRPFLRLIRKWLKAGVLEEDGNVRHPETGCPQGGCISPILANIYLHHVLDEWFHDVVMPRLKGDAYMCRYADDIVFAFRYEEEAEKFFRVLPKRLARFGLELSREKSRIVRFSRFKVGRPAKSFDFLGFEFRWIKDRQGTPRVMRRTSRKRVRRSLAQVTEWMRSQRSEPTKNVMSTLKRKLYGYWNYYGVQGNSRSLWDFHLQVKRIVLKWLNRRSQRRSYNWAQFMAVWKRFQIPKPRITECRYRQQVLNYAC